MSFLSELRVDEGRHPQGTMAPEYPVLTQGRKVKRLCDQCRAFRAGRSTPTAKCLDWR
jgi:hypothetical protein